MNTFNPKDYIVTVDGFRGYVVKRLDYCNNMYEVRLAGGLTVRGGEELQIDPLMYQEEVSDGADRFETCSMAYDEC
jgi:hypothetical protein